MLVQLLQLMAAGQGSTAIPELAERLGVSAGLVEQMIEQLVHLGYLESVELGCGESACRGCPQAGACATQIRARLWIVTERGRKLAG
jgi:hypothetical protein